MLKTDAPFPSETVEAGWRRRRVREAVDRDGYSLFKIGLKLSEIPKA